MRPVKISILGDYLDCQIYRGRLYLWTFDGALKVYRWEDIVMSLPNSLRDQLPLKFCFLDGNYLYKSDLIELFHDRAFKKILLEKFLALSSREYELTEKQVDKCLYGKQTTPGNILATDTEIYGSHLYYINEKGLFSATAHRPNAKYPVATKPVKLWDCNLLSLKANRYPQMALSGGDEGLYEFDMSSESNNRWNPKEPVRISSKHSSFANYAFWSIYNSSLADDSYLALFDFQAQKAATRKILNQQEPKFRRTFKQEINEREIFQGTANGNNLSWGVDDKIYRATEDGFEIVKFRNNPDPKKGQEYFKTIQSLKLHSWKGRVIGGGTSYYGTIIECENALVVMLSNNDVTTIPGPITRWRIYPRSLNYQNHLHVIKEDRIEIYSFNQDYFLDQNDKTIGLEYRPPRRRIIF